LTVAEGQYLQKGQRFLGLLVAGNILQDYFGFPVLSDNQRFRLTFHIPNDLSGMGLQKTDWFYTPG
jgi:hypothetical protein